MEQDAREVYIRAAFRAGASIPEIARRAGLRPSRVRRILMRAATRCWQPEETAEPEVPRCRACEMILNRAWCEWDEDGLCNQCQEDVAAMAAQLGLDDDLVLQLWMMPRRDPHDPDELTALEEYMISERVTA